MDYDPIDQPDNYKWGIFYFNKNDNRFIVPKRARALGWTFNFAHWGSYVMIAVLLGIVLFSILR